MSPHTRTAEYERALHRRLMRFGEAESLALPMWEERGTSVSSIAGQLARLWEQPQADDGASLVTEKGLSHARASVLNLVVSVVDTAAAERVVEAMLDLGVRHPSRAIVLVPQPSADGPPLDARISAHCNEAGGSRDQICYEELVLTIRGEAAEHLSGVVTPLLIHDLPTSVWWPGDPPFADPVFDQLVELGDRLIIDSADFADLLIGLRRLTTLRRRSGIGDLTWSRMAWWQELTAQFFDTLRFRRYLPNLNRLTLRYAVPSPGMHRPEEDHEVAPGVASPIAQALLYAGWIATRVGWRRNRTVEPLDDGRFHLRLEGRYEMVDLVVEPTQTDAVRPGDLVSARLRVLGEAGSAEFIIDRSEDGLEATVATNADGMTALLRQVAMESPSEAELLSTQLTSDTVDPVYEEALRAAAVLLASAREVNA